MPLRLTLKPRERVVIAGAVVQNGQSRAELRIENRVPVLREADILRPRDVRTPCERIVLAIQLLYVDGERSAAHLRSFESLVADVRAAAPSLEPLLDPVVDAVRSGHHYAALKLARHLLPPERELLSHVS